MAITVVRHVFEATFPRSPSATSSPAGSRSCSRFSPFRCWRSRSRFPSSRNDRPQLLGAQATRYHRAAERALIGRNVVANDAAEADPEQAVPDPSAQYAASRKLSVFLMSRSAIAPLAGAALIPFAIAGATKLPYKEVFALVKKLLVL